MTAAETIALAKARGVTIRPNGGDLELVAEREPGRDLLGAIASNKAEILSLLQVERARINHWIAGRLIDWPPDSCLHCRKPLIVGQRWAVVTNGEVTARFHQPCHAEWLVEQEKLARKALGLEETTKC